jgi:hypothetical protein
MRELVGSTLSSSSTRRQLGLLARDSTRRSLKRPGSRETGRAGRRTRRRGGKGVKRQVRRLSKENAAEGG